MNHPCAVYSGVCVCSGNADGEVPAGESPVCRVLDVVLAQRLRLRRQSQHHVLRLSLQLPHAVLCTGDTERVDVLFFFSKIVFLFCFYFSCFVLWYKFSVIGSFFYSFIGFIALCGLWGCKNRPNSISWLAVVKGD